MRFNKATKKALAVVCSLTMVFTSVAFDNINTKADDTWSITEANVTVLKAGNKNVYGIQDVKFSAYQGSEAGDYAYAAYIDEISADNAVKAANDWVWGIGNGRNGLHYDTVWTTKSGNITFEPGSTHTIIVAAYEKDTAGDAYDTTPLDTVTKEVTVPAEEITTEAQTTVAAGETEIVDQDTIDVDAISDWTAIGGNEHKLSVDGTIMYVSNAQKGTFSKNGGQEGFYTVTDGVTPPWNFNMNHVPVFSCVPGNGVTSVTINGVKYPNDKANFYVGNDCIFINQELFKLADDQDQKTFIITLNGIDVTFAAVVAREGVQIGETPESRGFTKLQGDNGNHEFAENWTAMINETNTVYYKAVDGGFTVFMTANKDNWEPYAMQYTYKMTGLKPSTKYTFKASVSGSTTDYQMTFDNVTFFNEKKDQKDVEITTVVTSDEEGNAEATVLGGIAGINVEVTFTDAQFTEYVEEESTEVEKTTEAIETESQTEEVSETESTVTPGEDDSEYASLEYKDIVNNNNNEFDQGLKGCQYALVKGTLNVCQFQNAGFAELYMAVGGMGAGNFKATVNGKDVTKTEGTGVFMNPASDFLTYKYNVVEISSDDGTATVIILNPNKVGTYKPETPVETTTTESTETTTEAAETTTESTETTTENTETTTEAVETTTEKQEPVEITMDQEFNTDGDHELGGYTIYVGQSWNGSTAVAGVDAEDADHIKVQQKTSNWGQAWGLQVKKEFSGLVPGAKYSISWKINAASNDGKVLVSNNETQIALEGGEQILTGEFTATEKGTGEFVVGMGWVGLANPIEFFAPEITKISEPETTTEAPETTTEAVETTKAQEETTTTPATTKADATTKATDATTVTTLVTPTTTAPATTVAPAKVTVKKVAVKKATKKKSAKKASIVLKKVSGAAGYQVKVSTSKKFAKKTTVTVNAKSVKVTGKKVKAGKTYYVKARAYKKVSGSK